MKGMDDKDTENYADATHTGLNKAAIQYADAVVIGDENVDQDLLNFVKKSEKAVLEYAATSDTENYYNFYQEIAADVLVSVA